MPDAVHVRREGAEGGVSRELSLSAARFRRRRPDGHLSACDVIHGDVIAGSGGVCA